MEKYPTMDQTIEQLKLIDQHKAKNKIVVLVPIDGQPGNYKTYRIQSIDLVPGQHCSIVTEKLGE